jgi:methionine-gamma-lyase
VVEDKIAALETHGLDLPEASALFFSSGMAAISAGLMSVLKSGDAVITHSNIYGTTGELLSTTLQRFGVQAIFGDLHDMQWLRSALSTDGAKVLLVETPNNPTLDCYDLEPLVALSHSHGVKVIVDSTFATPMIQQPFRFGVDMIVHSTTKYLNGHGTGIGGVVIGQDKEAMNNVWLQRKTVGGSASPFEAWLVNNGLKTLPLRMEKHSSNAMAIATWLSEHQNVAQVNYPGLESHPRHQLVKRQMKNSGGMLSFELEGGLDAGFALMKRIRFCTLTATLGTADTLIQHPASTSHVQVPREQRLASGITDGLIRMSVGLEDVDDVISDLAQAMDS